MQSQQAGNVAGIFSLSLIPFLIILTVASWFFIVVCMYAFFLLNTVNLNEGSEDIFPHNAEKRK